MLVGRSLFCLSTYNENIAEQTNKSKAKELIEYLSQRVRSDQGRPKFEECGLEHVLSYQRRIHATKQNFFRRNFLTPLGIVREWWVVASVFRI